MEYFIKNYLIHTLLYFRNMLFYHIGLFVYVFIKLYIFKIILQLTIFEKKKKVI